MVAVITWRREKTAGDKSTTPQGPEPKHHPLPHTHEKGGENNHECLSHPIGSAAKACMGWVALRAARGARSAHERTVTGQEKGKPES